MDDFFTYKIERRDSGWFLRLLEGGNQVDGEWFADDPADELESESSFAQAHRKAGDWLDDRMKVYR